MHLTPHLLLHHGPGVSRSAAVWQFSMRTFPNIPCSWTQCSRAPELLLLIQVKQWRRFPTNVKLWLTFPQSPLWILSSTKFLHIELHSSTCKANTSLLNAKETLQGQMTFLQLQLLHPLAGERQERARPGEHWCRYFQTLSINNEPVFDSTGSPPPFK